MNNINSNFSFEEEEEGGGNIMFKEEDYLFNNIITI